MSNPINAATAGMALAVQKIKRRKAGLCEECGEKPINALSRDGWCEPCEEAFKMEFMNDS